MCRSVGVVTEPLRRLPTQASLAHSKEQRRALCVRARVFVCVRARVRACRHRHLLRTARTRTGSQPHKCTLTHTHTHTQHTRAANLFGFVAIIARVGIRHLELHTTDAPTWCSRSTWTWRTQELGRAVLSTVLAIQHQRHLLLLLLLLLLRRRRRRRKRVALLLGVAKHCTAVFRATFPAPAPGLHIPRLRLVLESGCGVRVQGFV